MTRGQTYRAEHDAYKTPRLMDHCFIVRYDASVELHMRDPGAVHPAILAVTPSCGKRREAAGMHPHTRILRIPV